MSTGAGAGCRFRVDAACRAGIGYEYGRGRGLQDADASDLTQEVLRSVASAVRSFRYDLTRGAFRSWLFTVACTKLNDLAGRRRRQPVGSGDSAIDRRLDEIPARDDSWDEAAWDRAYRQRLLDWAAERVRGEFREATWRCFWGTALEQASPGTIAEELGMTVGAVYAAKSRVLSRLREVIRDALEDDLNL